MHLWIPPCNDEIHPFICGHFFSTQVEWFAYRNKRGDGCSARFTDPVFIRFIACGVDPHARVLPRPACLPGKHDGLASYFPGDPPALIRPDSASDPRVNLRSPSARLFNRPLPDSAAGFNRLDWNPD
ncbi:MULTISPECIES: hypothetical protein [Burkholderia cepacia complex]|uniref:hypothetical protein n=1 Tax=Burkholderia cepacia complex TaxID=87882 RepID=UPI0013DD9A1C|nr:MULTISPECIES: hypothetical protein [Burkholderia cepacia complex]